MIWPWQRRQAPVGNGWRERYENWQIEWMKGEEEIARLRDETAAVIRNARQAAWRAENERLRAIEKRIAKLERVEQSQ